MQIMRVDQLLPARRACHPPSMAEHRNEMTGPLASVTGDLHPLESVWWNVDDPVLRRALLSLECAEQMNGSARIGPQEAKAIREYLLDLHTGRG
jgi:hypothetical protein